MPLPVLPATTHKLVILSAAKNPRISLLRLLLLVLLHLTTNPGAHLRDGFIVANRGPRRAAFARWGGTVGIAQRATVFLTT